NLRRPRLLVRAARHGLSDYDRKRDLRRITGHSSRTTPSALIATLIEQEEMIYEARRKGDGTYSIARHIEVLVALMAECRLLPQEVRS
ncbi:MAG: hypothetical protein HKP40_10080, partial [Litoreibacter sp.]|nr:hypothetical protein [Litoreibacter sp.]